MPSPIDVHQYGRMIERQEQLLEQADIRLDNKRLIREFIDFYKVDPKVGSSRIRLYLYTLRVIGRLTSKSFKRMTEQDIVAVLARLGEHRTPAGTPYAENTMEDFRKTISKFWRWLYFDEYHGEAPPPIRRIKLRGRGAQNEPEIYTKDEIRQIINGASTIRDKAFFAVVYDLQGRVGEVLSRQMGHVRYTDGGDIQILVESTKAGRSHWETLFESVSYFTTWLRLHPCRDDPEAPLWVTQRKKGAIIPLRYATARTNFLAICKNRQIREGKKNSIQMLRRSKATHDIADGVPITYVEARGSWSKGSRALRDCYISVVQRDKDNAYRRKYGITASNGAVERTELQRCCRCEAIIEEEAKFCARCGHPVDARTAAEHQRLDVTSLVDEDMLSEMVRRFVNQELAGKGKIAAQGG